MDTMDIHPNSPSSGLERIPQFIRRQLYPNKATKSKDTRHIYSPTTPNKTRNRRLSADNGPSQPSDPTVISQDRPRKPVLPPHPLVPIFIDPTTQVTLPQIKTTQKKRQRRRGTRFERIYVEDQADVEGLVSRMRLLWSEYASYIMEQHFIQSPQSLVVSMYSVLAMQHAAKAGERSTIAQLYAMVSHSDVPEELLVPPTQSLVHPRRETLLVQPNRTHAYALNSAQLLLTHQLALACCQLFFKLQNMQCMPLLRNLIARPRNLVPAFLIGCPPEVEIDMAHFIGMSEYDALKSEIYSVPSTPTVSSVRPFKPTSSEASPNAQYKSDDRLDAFTLSSSILPEWFTHPRATQLDRLAALLRLELASSTSQILKSLFSSGLTNIRAQRVYDMLLRAVRLFAFTSYINPNLRWTSTEFSSGQFDSKTMQLASSVDKTDDDQQLWVLFSVSPGIVIENIESCTSKTLVPERVFAIPRPVAATSAIQMVNDPILRPGSPEIPCFVTVNEVPVEPLPPLPPSWDTVPALLKEQPGMLSRTPSAQLLEAALVLGEHVRLRTPTSSRLNSAATTPILDSRSIPATAKPEISQSTSSHLPPFPLGPDASVGEQAREWLATVESKLAGLELGDVPRTVSAENVLRGIRVAEDQRKQRSRKSATFSIESGENEGQQYYHYY